MLCTWCVKHVKTIKNRRSCSGALKSEFASKFSVFKDLLVWYLVKNDPPNCFNCVKGFLVSIARTLPGIFPGSPFNIEVHIKYCLRNLLTIVNYMKCISSRLRSNPHAWIFLLEDVPVIVEIKKVHIFGRFT